MFLFLDFFSNVPGGLRHGATVINRPSVAGAVLQTPTQLSKVRILKKLLENVGENVHPPRCVTCHMSHVMCHVSIVTCHVSCVTCHVSNVTGHNFFYIHIFFVIYSSFC